jgi:hypothetical protein
MLYWKLVAVPSLDPPQQHIFYTSFIGHQVLVVYSRSLDPPHQHIFYTSFIGHHVLVVYLPSLDPPHQRIFYTSFTSRQVMVFFWPSLDPLDQVVLILLSLSLVPFNRDSSPPRPLNGASSVFLDEFRSFFIVLLVFAWLNLNFFVCASSPSVPTLLWGKCEDETHIPEIGTLEYFETSKILELDCRGQNT